MKYDSIKAMLCVEYDIPQFCKVKVLFKECKNNVMYYDASWCANGKDFNVVVGFAAPREVVYDITSNNQVFTY